MELGDTESISEVSVLLKDQNQLEVKIKVIPVAPNEVSTETLLFPRAKHIHMNR